MLCKMEECILIQDIAPHRFDRTYSCRTATPSEYVLCCGEDDVVLRQEGEQYYLPRFYELKINGADARCLFSLDGTGCYLAAPPAELPKGFVRVSGRELRQVRTSHGARHGGAVHGLSPMRTDGVPQALPCSDRCGDGWRPAAADPLCRAPLQG